MAVLSSFPNDSDPHSHFIFSNSETPSYMHCYNYTETADVFSSFLITKIVLLLPFCTFILHHGLQHWWQKRSSSSSAATSHSDCFTYHIVVMELMGVVGCFLTFCGIYTKKFSILIVGLYLMCLNWFGGIFLNGLTCVEHYLAVVHPVTYLSLRNERGVRIRNMSLACVWLLCVAGVFLIRTRLIYAIINFCLSALFLAIVCFCCLSVLCVLIRPKPGDQGAERKMVDQSKRRAFYTILVILGVLVVRFVLGVVWAVLDTAGEIKNCVTMTLEVWFNLLSSLVLPLLFLHRTGKLVCFKRTTRRA